ncbi:uncharacterized protein LOC122301911 [Carya illinoinensis]|uniref:uncharacterized protein LOC122301911 n=1 Tax=Carya illinoinensis TaxID=32201 RepID=UPI001C7263F8|nr:uncharacterized protein LOC122301911 [Carya illinoinensis]
MGFQDLHLFNLALLAKQGWRLLRNDDSLLYKVYKAKYFPNSSLFEAKAGASSSYVWNGIWEALDCLRKVCRWRVGNGQTIRIFKDPWLPDGVSVSSLIEVDENLKVHSLIDASTGWWNVHMMRALFNPNLIQQILKLQISVNSEDSLYWSHEKTGSFSVKSAYCFLQQNQHLSYWQSSSGNSEAVFWKSLWHLKLPKKMKIFAWKACQEKLPTYLNLKKKYVLDDAACVLCNQAGVGVVLRNHNGEVVVACSKVEKEVSFAEFIEAIALLRGLQLCVQWGVPKLMLKTDCLILVNALNENSECLTDFAFILQDIRRLMAAFQEVKVVHVNRLGNLVAHLLARHVWLINDICMWWDFCPSFISQAIWLDQLAICKDL